MSLNTVIRGLTGTQETVANVMMMMVTTTSFLGNKNKGSLLGQIDWQNV